MAGKWVRYVLVLSLGVALLLTMYLYDVYKAMETGSNRKATQTHTKPVNKTGWPNEIANVPIDIMDQLMMLNTEKVAHDDPRLIQMIRNYFIYSPSKEPYHLLYPNRSDYAGQGKDNVVPTLLKDLPDNGFFVECGALDGETLSSTLYFEKTRNFSGLLVEANVGNFKKLLQKQRKAYAVNACLSPKPYPITVNFNAHGGIGRLVEGTFEHAYRHHHGFKLKKQLVMLQCFPLYSLLLALGRHHVDFFGLDIEGSELDILNTIPFDKVTITYVLAEFSHGEGGKPAMMHFFNNTGYKLLKTFREDVIVHKI